MYIKVRHALIKKKQNIQNCKVENCSDLLKIKNVCKILKCEKGKDLNMELFCCLNGLFTLNMYSVSAEDLYEEELLI